MRGIVSSLLTQVPVSYVISFGFFVFVTEIYPLMFIVLCFAELKIVARVDMLRIRYVSVC